MLLIKELYYDKFIMVFEDRANFNLLENKMKKRIYSLILLTSTLFILSGCGNSRSELDSYRESVEDFYDEVIAVNDRINSIDAESENAPEELLEELDTLNELFQDFAELEVPEEYMAVESLADEAASFMDESVTLYHSAYSDGTFNSFTAGMAYDKYGRAILRINYIGDILQGKEIDDENVNLYYGDE